MSQYFGNIILGGLVLLGATLSNYPGRNPGEIKSLLQ